MSPPSGARDRAATDQKGRPTGSATHYPPRDARTAEPVRYRRRTRCSRAVDETPVRPAVAAIASVAFW